MSVYTLGRLIEDFRTIAGEASSDWWGAKALQTVEEALGMFLTARWPFNEGEGVIASVAPYSTGTVAVVNGSPTVTGTGTTWDTSWITPAVVRVNGSGGDAMMVASFNSTTGLTLDGDWPFDSDPTATYSIEFPAHEIDPYISVTGIVESRLSISNPLRRATMESMLARRPWAPSSWWPVEYEVIPSDGTTNQKIFVWPPPAQVQTFRYRYVKSVPAFRYYRTGTASATNAITTVTGGGTPTPDFRARGVGYSLAGDYFEFLDANKNQAVQVASVTDATHFELVAGGWTGLTSADLPYCVSPKLLVPDDLRTLLRAICRLRFYQEAMPDRAPEAERRYISLRDQAINRYQGGRDVGVVMPIMTFGPETWGGPGLPSVLKVE